MFLFTGCQKASDENKKILHLNLWDDPVSFDPRLVRVHKDMTLVQQLFEGLTRMDANFTPQPAIAREIDISDDCLTYTFKLREAYWSNGDPVTAYDFENAWTQALDPSFASDYSYMLYPLKNAQFAREGKCSTETVGVAAVDDQTLVVQLHTPTPYFLTLTAFSTYFPVHPRSEKISNGPFKLFKWTPQFELLIEKNPTYWDADAVQLDGISFSIINDSNTQFQLFEKGELDWLGQPFSRSIATELIAKMREEGRLDSYSVAGTFWLKFNTTNPPFDQPNLRRALSYAINREEIITHILQGNQTLATGPLPPSMALTKHAYFQDGNRDLAKKLFETCVPVPKITLNYIPSERTNKIVQLIQQQWKEALGIEVELQGLEFQVYRQNIKQGLYQVGTGEWIADFNDPIAFLELFKYRNDEETGHGMNDTGWQDKHYTALLDASLAEKDPDKRRELLREAEEILVESMVVAPLYHYAFDYVKKSSVQNVVLSPLGTADFKCANIIK